MTEMLPEQPLLYVVDDDRDLAESVVRMLGRHGYRARAFTSPTDMLAAYEQASAVCVITDVMMGKMDGFAFAAQLSALDPAAALIFMTAWPTTADAVDSIRTHGGVDYLEKPLDQDRMLASIAEGVEWSKRQRTRQMRLASLSPREQEVLELLVKGLSNKAIAAELGLSPKTVEDHRARIAAKTGTSRLAQLIALVSD